MTKLTLIGFKQLLKLLATFEYNIKNPTPSDHFLWRTIKEFKRPIIQVFPIRRADGNQARLGEEKEKVFVEHLEEVFNPLLSQSILSTATSKIIYSVRNIDGN